MRRWLAGKTLLWQFAIGSLVAISIIGVVLGWTLGEVIRRQAVEELMDEARGGTVQRVLRQLSGEDMAKPMTGERYDVFHQFIQDSVVSQRTARIKIWNRDGLVIYSSRTAQIGQAFPIEANLAAALSGHVAGELSELQALENAAEKAFGHLLEVYVPLVLPDSTEVIGAFEVYQHYEQTARFIERAQQLTYGGLAVGLTLLYLSLFAIVKRGADTISLQQVELQHRAQALKESYDGTLAALCAALDLRDRETEGHSRRVSQLTLELAQGLKVPAGKLKAIEYGALLHDIGKIGVSDTILLKPGGLTDDEWKEMRKHSSLGYRMLSGIEFLKDAAEMVHAHHERWDGKGYPRRLAGTAIPLGARLFAVIDTYDAMTSNRPYRSAMSHQQAVEEIRRNAGTQFDPAVTAAFLSLAGEGSCAAARGLSADRAGATVYRQNNAPA